MVSCYNCKNMADNFFDMLVFVRVTQAGSLSGAARELNLSLAVVSRRLARLEERLGVRLANRTTRTLTLTEEGARFHARCLRILADIDEAETEVTSGRDTATGLLRVTSTLAFGTRWLAPILSDFQQNHPRLHIHLNTSDNVTNIVEDGYDLAVRFGSLADSSLVARQLAPNLRVICGSPSYLDSRGRPIKIEQLLEHDCIAYGEPPLDHWTFLDGESVSVKGPMTTNNGVLAHELALRGGGLVMKSLWDVYEDIQAGNLEIVLPDRRLAAAPIHAVYPHNRLAAAKVRLCVDHLASALKKQSERIPFRT